MAVASDNRPTAQEIEELIDLVRRDPGSPAFIDLSEAYLSLGRPRDAIQTCNVGLDASPDSLEGRVMLARAYAAMHQWKEAQGELLRVVKVDRSNRQGFALLGEVLLRRSDYERAVPVLQHAQNLDPTSPHILNMLRRARAGQGLDPPAPVPTPVPPRGETDNGAEMQRGRGAPPPKPQLPRPNQPMQVPTSGPAMPTMAIDPAPAYNPAAYAAPAPAPAPRGPKQTAPPPMSVEGVRPRVVSAQKQHNAAAASLRQSAAVGENYLNDLLTGGLLEVPGVRVADGDFDLRPDRRWGRSTRRAFIFLFVVLVLGIGGGGTWYWWTEKQKEEAITRLQREAKVALGTAATYDGMVTSLEKLTEALKKDKDDVLSRAYSVEIGGLAALLYGTPTTDVDLDYKWVSSKKLAAGEPGARELVIGHAALELSRLHLLEPRNAVTTLGDLNRELDEYIAKNAEDPWAHWLRGRAMLAAGERKGARAKFEKASEGDKGIVVAIIDRADLAVDDGDLDKALDLYKQADVKSKDHPLEVLGRSLGRAEASRDVDEMIGELNDKFVISKMPPRATAYRWLALALANIGIEDYPKATEAIKKATAKPPGDPRFWARVAWVHYVLGDLKAAALARDKCVWYSKNPEDDPTVQLVDSGILLASGLPEKALTFATKIEGPRSHIIRAYALIDLGKPKEALAEADAVLKAAENNREAKILREQARMLAASPGKERDGAAEELERLARAANSKLGRHALGVAWLALGDYAKAKDPLKAATTEVSETSPNPLIYRTHTALAEIALHDNEIAEAGKQLDLALAANLGYFPTRVMQARVVLKNKEPEKALGFLEPIMLEPAAITPIVLITRAEALATKGKATKADKEEAKKIVIELKPKVPVGGVTMGDLARVAELIEEKLSKTLELGEPSEAGAITPEAPPTKKEPKKGGGRRRGK